MACRWDAVWKAEPSPGDLGFLVNEPGAGVPSLQLWHLLQALGLDPALWRAENACQVPPAPRACVHVTLLLPTGTQEPCFVDVDSRAQRGHTACPRSPAGHGWPLLLYHVPSEAPALAGPISPGLCPPPDWPAWSSKVHSRLLSAHSTAWSSSLPSNTLSLGSPGL